MAVAIKTVIAHEQYSVNGKLVYKDGNGNWVATAELTTKESEQFQSHLLTLDKNKN